jgi:hypothetical protein
VLAAHLLGRLTTPSQAAIRAERKMRLQEALNSLDPIDREVLVLRHFKELSNGEAAAVLALGKLAASKRYARALIRIKDVLACLPEPHSLRHRPAEADFDFGHGIGHGTRGCCAAVLGGATRSRIGLGVTSHEAV